MPSSTSSAGLTEQMNAQSDAAQPPVAFQSLVDRSIAAWQTIYYVGPEPAGEERTTMMNDHVRRLQSYHSLEEVLQRRGYWFFQLRESFMRQTVFLKWDPTRLDDYILLPISYGFANNQDCFFVSHYWRTREHPDPQAVDLVQFQQDLKDEEWSYIWIDWTCMPQGPRTETQRGYFSRMLRYIPMLIRDCGFAWRFPAFEPRAWILYEVAEYVINHTNFIWTDDNRPFINHISEMVADDVRPVVERYGYRCTSQSDLDLVIGWLEVLILLAKILPNDTETRQHIFDRINEPYTGSFTDYSAAPAVIAVDKVNGVISYQGETYKFTPIFHLTSST